MQANIRLGMIPPVTGETNPAFTICVNVITRTTKSILRPALAGRVILRRSASEGSIPLFLGVSRFLIRLSQMPSRSSIHLVARPSPGRPSGHNQSRLVIRQRGLGVVVERRRRARKSRDWARIGDFVYRFPPPPRRLSHWERRRPCPDRNMRLEKPLLW